MNNGNPNNISPHTDPSRLADAQAERAATSLRASQAEVQRDMALDIADESVAERDMAAAIAAEESANRLLAEQQEMSARIAANRAHAVASEAHTQNMLLRSDLARERDAAQNANFMLALVATVLLAAVIGFGLWYVNRPGNAANGVAAGAATPAATTARSSSMPAAQNAVRNVYAPPAVTSAPPPPPPSVIIVQPASANSGSTNAGTGTAQRSSARQNGAVSTSGATVGTADTTPSDDAAAATDTVTPQEPDTGTTRDATGDSAARPSEKGSADGE